VTRLWREEKQRKLAELHKEELMSVVSHELRTPAANAKSALDLILEGDAGEISEDVRKYIKMASLSTSRLLHLIKDFLDIQKYESGHLLLNKENTVIDELVTRVVENNKMYSSKFNCEFRLIKPLVHAEVYCDKYRIEQVLTNLLSNAAKYGSDKDVIEISVSRIKNSIRVAVTDHGPGIPKHFQSRIFEKFAMAATHSNNSDVESTGLGLSIAKAIITLHAGNIGFESKTGIGSTFYFELPSV